MKIIFMGTPEFATYALDALYKSDHEIVAVYTQPPKMQNRGHKLELSKIHQLADSFSLNVKTPSSLKKSDIQEEFRSLNADVAIVSAYGMILPRAILEATKYGCINIHPSLLPRWRGAAPIQRMMLEGDMETAICIMKMDEGLDTGPIISSRTVTLSGKETFLNLQADLANIGSEMLLEVLDNIDNLTYQTQENEGVTYADKISKEEAKINWSDHITKIDRVIRTLNPPGAYFEHLNERIKILKADIKTTEHNYKPGEVVDENLTIAAGGGYLLPLMVQRPGKRAMDIADMLRGYKIPKGIIL